MPHSISWTIKEALHRSAEPGNRIVMPESEGERRARGRRRMVLGAWSLALKSGLCLLVSRLTGAVAGGLEPSSPHQHERGFPLDRTFEIVHLPSSKVLGLSLINHETVELQRAGRLLPHQRWVYDREHGIWNPFSGRALAMSIVGDAAFVTTVDLTAEQDIRAPRQAPFPLPAGTPPVVNL